MIEIKIFLTNLILIAFSGLCAGQNKPDSLKPLAVGDIVPDLLFEKVINHSHSALSLSDFDGKALILDFWATWCVPCVASIPKMDQLQQGNLDAIKVIMLTNDKEENIQRFYHNAPELSLPTAIYSKEHLVAELFPHVAIPHYVWIGKDRRVLAITENLDLTESKKAQLLAGEKVDEFNLIPMSDTEQYTGLAIDSIEVVGGRIFRISVDTFATYESKIRKYDERLTPVSFLDYNGANGRRLIYQVNYPIASLFMTAFLKRRNPSLKYESRFNAVLIDMADSTVTYPLLKDRKAIKQWEADNYYSYYLTHTGNGIDSAGMFQIMQRDLSNYFNIKAEFRQESIRCLVLQRLPDFDSDKIRSGGGTPKLSSSIYDIELVNQPVSTFFSVLSRYRLNKTDDYRQLWKPILDEADIKFPINLHVKCNISDLLSLNKELENYGLVLKEEYREQPTLVLSR